MPLKLIRYKIKMQAILPDLISRDAVYWSA
jgi:hypothetical protein